MLHSLALPPYENVKKFEGLGNFAVAKYYKFPFSFFYRKKLKMILSHLSPDYIYRNILDFGPGQAEILKPSLEKRALQVKCVDKNGYLDYRWRFDVVTCASVLEFVNLPYTLYSLKKLIAPGGFMVVASPMDTWLTRAYFFLIGNRILRNSHKEILDETKKLFTVKDYSEWFGLYFTFKAYPV